MSGVRPALQIVWPDAMLNITKALPNFYETPAELPQHLLTLLNRMEQNPAAQQRQPRHQLSDRERFVLAGIITAAVCALIVFLSFYYPMII
jgi:hypothetical protein